MNSPPVTHRDILKRLSDAERASLRERSDAAGLAHLAGHLGLLALTGSYITLQYPGWQLAMLPHGVLLIFLFTLLHETVHDTPFRSLWLNRLAGGCCGFLLVLPPLWFRYFHLAHHRFTHDPEKDPELEQPKPQTWRQYLIYLSGIPTWISQLRALFDLAFTAKDQVFVPPAARPRTRRQARLFLALYAVIAIAAFLAGFTSPLWLWLVPMLLGQPFLRAFLLAEHTRCAHVSNMLENTRTTFTGAFIRFIAWNMPYHAEHHSYPVVPFHKLPALHEKIKAHLLETEAGYGAFHRKMAGSLR